MIPCTNDDKSYDNEILLMIIPSVNSLLSLRDCLEVYVGDCFIKAIESTCFNVILLQVIAFATIIIIITNL